MEPKSYDVIIIGAGLGGLAAGAILSQAGKSVLMIEQHNIVGGAATHFVRKRTMRFEVGLHELDGMGRDSKRQLFKDLGILDRLELVQVPEFYRVSRGDFEFTMPDGLEDAEKALKAAFPNEHSAIDRYLSDLKWTRSLSGMLAWGWGKRLSKLFTLLSAGIKFLRYRRMTVGQYMDKLTQDEDLKLALITNLGYYHDDPYSCSLILFLFGQSSYITGGGWFIKGGSQILSDKLAEVITENGGSILTKHKVTKILTEGITAVGVEFMRQKRPDTLLQQARGKYIVANAPLPLVVDELLSDHDIDTSKLDALEPGCSLITIYYSLSEAVAPETDGIYSSFVYDDSVTSLKEFGPTERSGDYSRKGYVVVNYSVIDHGLGSPTMVICGVDYLKNWEGMSKDEYKQRKEEVMDIYQERLEKQFPGIGSKITYREMSTPRTIQRYTLNPHGTVYGYAPTPKQFLRNRTKLIKPKINNLFYASAWVGVGGFSSALQFGSRTAKRILRKEEK